MMRVIRLVLVGLFATTLFLHPTPAATNSSAEATVLEAMKIGSDALKHKRSLGVILPFFDAHSITRQSMSRAEWSRLTKAGKQQEVQWAAQRILNLFSSGLERYIDAEIRFTSRSGTDRLVQLAGNIYPQGGGEHAEVIWQLRCAPECKMTNVVISGFSLTDLIRSERRAKNRNNRIGR